MNQQVLEKTKCISIKRKPPRVESCPNRDLLALPGPPKTKPPFSISELLVYVIPPNITMYLVSYVGADPEAAQSSSMHAMPAIIQ